MRNRLEFWYSLGSAVLLAALVGCASEPHHTEADLSRYLDKTLSKVSVDLALLRMRLLVNKERYCLFARVFTRAFRAEKKTEAERTTDIAERLMAEMARGDQGLCDLFTQAIIEAQPVFDEVKSTLNVQSELYTFFLFVEQPSETEKDLFSKKDLGPFRNLEACERLESHARSLDFPTRRCKQWEPKNH